MGKILYAGFGKENTVYLLHGNFEGDWLQPITMKSPAGRSEHPHHTSYINT